MLCTGVSSLSETIRGQVCLRARLGVEAGEQEDERGLLKQKEKQAERGKGRRWEWDEGRENVGKRRETY